MTKWVLEWGGTMEVGEEASWCSTVCLASFLIPSNAAALSFLHPCTFFLGIDDTRRGNFLFFSKTKKRGLKVVVVQSSPIIPSVKVASRTFLLLFCVWLWLRQQFVWCPSKLLSLWETKQWCESLCYYDGISLEIATENLVRHKILFLFYEPYHFLESHLESLLGTEFCWVSI